MVTTLLVKRRISWEHHTCSRIHIWPTWTFLPQSTSISIKSQFSGYLIWQVWSIKIQMDSFLSITGWHCIHICIQNSSSDFHCQRWYPCTHLIQEFDILLPCNQPSFHGLQLWKPVGIKIRIRSGVTPHSILQMIKRWCCQTGNHFPTAPQIQDPESIGQKITDHRCEVKVGVL